MKKIFAIVLLLGSLFFSSNAMQMFQRDQKTTAQLKCEDVALIKEGFNGGYNLIKLALYPDRSIETRKVFFQYFKFVFDSKGFTCDELNGAIRFFENAQAQSKKNKFLKEYFADVLKFLKGDTNSSNPVVEMFTQNYPDGSPTDSQS